MDTVRNLLAVGWLASAFCVSANPESFRVLGGKDLGVNGDYRTAKMPPVNAGLLDGHLAWRQHDAGHEDQTNMTTFLP